ASELARHLRKLGLGRESLVGISIERSLEMVVAILGVLKAGAAYVPLDPTYPRDRLAFMIEDAGVRLVLTQERLSNQVNDLGVAMLCLDRELEAQMGSGERAATLLLNPSMGAPAVGGNIAYVIYTSGSTGQPKGVMAPHRAVTNMILWMQSAYSMTAGDRLLQKTAVSFDASAWEFFWPLVIGGTLVMARPYLEKDGDYMVRTLR